MHEQHIKLCQLQAGKILVLFCLFVFVGAVAAAWAQASAFSIGDRVQPIAVLNVRSNPSISSLIVGTEAVGAKGTIKGGPATADGYEWWQVKYDNNVTGWSAGIYLVKEDPIAPTVSIVAPAGNSTVSGAVQVIASASDNIGVTKVEFYVSSTLETTIAAPPYAFNWNTAFTLNGSRKLTAKAYDAVGNVGTSVVTVNVLNVDATPPSVSILSPADGQAVSGIIDVKVSAYDNAQVANVNLLVDGTPLGSVAADYYNDFSWDTTLATNADHVLVATARDAAGNVATSTAVTVSVRNVNLNIGDRVQTTINLNARETPSLSGAIKVVEAPGAGGVIVGGPTVADGHKWWRVKYDDGIDGWSVGAYLAASSASSVQQINKFSIGDNVQTTTGLNVRSSPSTTSTIIGTETKEAQGTVIGGPVVAGGYTWWQINYSDGVSGWSVGDYLTEASQPSPSTKFSAGDRVQTTASLNVRDVPSTVGNVLGTQPSGVQGTVLAVPYYADSYWWWNVNYDTGADGWSAENYLTKIAATTTTSGSPVTIASPLNGATVSGNITITAAIKSGYTIAKVEFYWGQQLGIIDTSAPYLASFSTLNFSNGKMDISAKAYDTAGNVYTSPTVTVNIYNAPKFAIGDHVRTTASTNVRSSPVASGTTITVSGQTISGNILGTQPYGALGVVSSGPIYAYDYGWWLVDFNSSPDGWSVQDYLIKVTATATTTSAVVDRTPPIVSIVSPTSGETLSNAVMISANAVDNIGVARVAFYVDGIYKGVVTASSSPYSFNWDSSSVVNGSHAITARAYDGSGNAGVSSAITITTTNVDATPPRAYISSPRGGQTVSGIARVSVGASDNVGVTSINLLVDGALVGPDIAASYYTFLWDTNLVANNASHTLAATARDAAGNIGNMTPITVGVKNPPPSTKFSVGDHVIVTSYAYARSLPTTYVTSLGAQSVGAIGTVIGGSEYSDSYFWWKIDFDSGADGWVAENYLEKLSDNLLADPGFEAGGSAWQNSAADGRMVTNSDFHGGTQSEEINVSSLGLRPVYEDVDIIPGASYAARGWIKASGAGGGGARIYVLWFSSSPTNYAFPQNLSSIYSQGNLVRVDSVGSGIVGTKDWTIFSSRFVAPWTAKIARFLLVMDKDPDNIGNARFDDLGLFRYGPLPPPDTTPPTVAITSPAKGFSVSTGTVNISASASDNTAVAKVDIYVDGALVASRAASPCSYSWSTSGVGEGAHTIQATAIDIANNTSSTTNTVYIDRTPPTAATGLQAQAATPTQVNLTWSPASDNIDVAGYKVTRNGSYIASALNGASYSDGGAMGASYYTYTVSAYDAAGNTSQPSNQANAVTPSPAPSTKFKIGDGVQTLGSASVRNTPSLTGAVLGTQTSVADTFPPTVNIVSPHEGSTLTQTATITASASDIVICEPVAIVPVCANGISLAVFALSNHGRGTVAGGPVYAGGYWWWNVNFYSDPSGWVQEISLRNAGVTKVEFYLEGIMFAAASSPPYTVTFNIGGFPSSGPFALYAKAYDTAGNVGTSPTVHVSIYSPPPDITPPTVSFANIADNSVVSSTVQVIASASDNVGVKKVEFYVDGLMRDSKTSAPYSFLWNTVQDGDGVHIINLMAYDAAGNMAVSSYLTITVQAPPPS